MHEIEFLNVICYKWGKLYSSDDVNILHSMVRRNLSIPHTFHCITDDDTGLDDDIRKHELIDTNIPGNGRKLRTFSSDFLGLGKQDFVVSLDVDIVIVSSIDFLADSPEKEFAIARHRNGKPGSARGHGAVYRLRVGSRRQVWDRFIADPDAAARLCPAYHAPADGKPISISEQKWLDHTLDEIEYLPEGTVVSFSRDCNARAIQLFGKRGAMMGLTTSHFGMADPPEGAAIVSFHGPVLPKHVRDGRHGRWRRAPFVAKHWHK